MSIQESLKLKVVDQIAIMEWDLVGEKVNKLSSPVMMRLRELLDEVQAGPYKALVMISRKPGIFIAGADIEEIKAMKKKEDFMKALEEAHQIFNKIEDLKVPVIAAIHGQCLGGGCEMSLACKSSILLKI
jgi:3-hydroxyacyl-CoA dehydrogenase/enoyl-CoA hydratase/3-hydroxybutyryl-CoA epimerase